MPLKELSIIVISKFIEWSLIYKKHIKLLAITVVGTIAILLVIFIYSELYRNTNSIESSSEITESDYLYYSTVTYFTVGYGDITPNRKSPIGRNLFISECFLSLILKLRNNWIFFLIYSQLLKLQHMHHMH